MNPKKIQWHNGTDYGCYGRKEILYAPEPGTVTVSKKTKNRGNWIKVHFPSTGRKWSMYHLSERLVKKGQKVKAGQPLGKVGTTGLSTGVHLHLGCQKIGKTKFLDPHAYNYTVPK